MKKKIFVITGSTYPFDRLIKEIDKINKNKKYRILAQIGKSKYIPENIEFNDFLEYEDIIFRIKQSDIVITHAGVGTILDVLTQNKKLILFPRLKKYDEAIDDHQLEICKAFEEKFGINWTKNEQEIEKLINNVKIVKTNKKENKLVNEIKNLI
jgi:beta-1,4-N-acetylglucosaminyltransferase